MNRKEAIRLIREKSGLTYARVVELVDSTDSELIEHFIREGRMGGGITTDPIESDPVAGPIIRRVWKEAYEIKKRERGGDSVWPPVVDTLAQHILKTEYGIEWKTEQQMNPDVHFNYGQGPATD